MPKLKWGRWIAGRQRSGLYYYLGSFSTRIQATSVEREFDSTHPASKYDPFKSKRARMRQDIEEVSNWLDNERAYAEGKWPLEIVDEMDQDSYTVWVNQYLHRAKVLGWDTPNGRQALCKALRTLLAMTESNVRRFGALPPGGVPSGQINDE